MSNNALVLLWKGQNLSDNLIKKIAEVLLTNEVCIPEMLTIKYKDEESVANALIRDCVFMSQDIDEENPDRALEAVKQAVIYIGTRFRSTLSVPNGDLTAFTIELSLAFRDEKNMEEIESSTHALYNAVEIIATKKAIIPHTLARKYHLTQKVCDIIKKIYNAY